MEKVQINSQKMTKQPWASYCKKQTPTRNQTARDLLGQSIQSDSQVTCKAERVGWIQRPTENTQHKLSISEDN